MLIQRAGSIWGSERLSKMRVNCLHGYFIFEETKVGQVSDFANKNGFDIVFLDNGKFTFSKLAGISEHIIKGQPLGDFPAIQSFEGEPWELMQASGVVYDFVLDQVRPIQSITAITQLKASNNWLISKGLILPGSLLENGQRIKSYSGWFSRERGTWLYEGVLYV